MVKRAGGGPLSTDLSKELILSTARKLFIENGFEKTSMRQVAQKLACSHGAIYYHFANKAELFQEIVAADFLKLEVLIDEVMEQNVDNRTKCQMILRQYIQFGLQNKSHYEMMFMLRNPEAQSYLPTQSNQTYEKFAHVIFQLTDEKLTVQDIWSLFLSLHGFVSYYCFTSQTYEDMLPLVNIHVNFLLRGI